MPKLINTTNLGLVDGIEADEKNTMPLFGTCSTATGTAAKAVACEEFAELTEGASVRVLFANASGSSDGALTLNVNQTGARGISLDGSTTVPAYAWLAGSVVDFVFASGLWVAVQLTSNTGTAVVPAADGWSGPDSAGLYYCTVSVETIGANSDVMITPMISTADLVTGKAQQDAWNLHYYSEAVSGGIKFYAEAKPTTAVTFEYQVL